ncbi:MAG: hypothetical protein IJ209_09885 [Bacteroidaceae bacterium]|nr:hypothetical protein [Bacteroidaceae bacterium]
MRIKVNRKMVEVFDGASVRHAVLSYLAWKRLDATLAESLTATDRHGHQIDLDAPASQHEAIRIRLNAAGKS